MPKAHHIFIDKSIYLVLFSPQLCFHIFRYFTSAPSPTDPAKLPKPLRKQESKASYGKHEAIKVVSPPRKIRRVMPERGRVDGMKSHVDKDQQAPMSLDFTVLAERPPNRPTITR